MNYQIYTDIRNGITLAGESEKEDLNELLGSLCQHGITEAAVLDSDGVILYSSDSSKTGSSMPGSAYSYSFGKSEEIRFIVDRSYINDQLRSVVLNMLTILVTSVFFSVEIVIFMIRLIARNMADSLLNAEEAEDEGADKTMMKPLYYIRQIAFLFYFGSRLSGAFIPTMAKSLMNPFPWISDTAAAGLPQTAETLLTCSAIFITTIILEKKGWKMPFISGLFMVALGTFLSAFSTNLLIFVLARAIVGLGYGFCWMTMRNLSLFGRNNKEQLLGFALLNAGIYAGMNCGASLGAILAEIFGYKTVFIISAVMTVVTSVFIIRMENELLPRKEEKEIGERGGNNGKTALNPRFIQAVLFVILMIAPASISASFLSYYLPLYFEEIGRSISDVGRAQLLYGIVIVYAGPLLSVFIVSLRQKKLKNINFIYNILIALSLFLPGIGAGILLPFMGAALLGSADSFGFGVQNNYFLDLPAVKRMGASKSLSVLSFIKKMFEMAGPLVFAAAITAGYQPGIKIMASAFAIMAVLFLLSCSMLEKKDTGEGLL